MRVVDLIEIKKNKGKLSKEQIEFLVDGFTSGEVKDYQMASMAMAIRLNGMDSEETSNLTLSMMNSGEMIDLTSIKGIKVDKHSTGGVGDKTSIAVGPIVASLGAVMAKMSGRGLGFTGGTLDKLESIEGFNITLTNEEFIKQVNEIGLAIIGQTANVCPADKKLYALRDVTATVDSLPLIVSSIMSKKLATGSDAILLDVKMGDGAFMKTFEDATELAEAMIAIGKHLNRDVKAEITNMNRPLGRAIGNKNEIIEVIETLQGNGPKDFVELITSASATILIQSKIFDNEKDAEAAVTETIKNGKALAKFKEWIIAQGGDLESILKESFLNPKHNLEIRADKDGYMEITSAVAFGIAAMKLGAGRETKEALLDYDAGIYLNKKTNEKVSKGDVLFTLSSSKEISNSIKTDLENAYNINETKVENKIILGKLG